MDGLYGSSWRIYSLCTLDTIAFLKEVGAADATAIYEGPRLEDSEVVAVTVTNSASGVPPEAGLPALVPMATVEMLARRQMSKSSVDEAHQRASPGPGRESWSPSPVGPARSPFPPTSAEHQKKTARGAPVSVWSHVLGCAGRDSCTARLIVVSGADVENLHPSGRAIIWMSPSAVCRDVAPRRVSAQVPEQCSPSALPR